MLRAMSAAYRAALAALAAKFTGTTMGRIVVMFLLSYVRGPAAIMTFIKRRDDCCQYAGGGRRLFLQQQKIK